VHNSADWNPLTDQGKRGGPSKRSPQNIRAGDSSSKGTASLERYSARLGLVGGLVGALLGALSGGVGTYLVYRQTEHTQSVAHNDRLADIRRQAYGEFLAQTQSVRNDYVSINNEVAQGVASDKVIAQINTTLGDDVTKWARAAGTVDLVASEPVRKAAIQTSLARDSLTELAKAVILFRKGQNKFNAPYSADDFRTRLENFDRKVQDFVSVARADVV
jgi:hypothetical protein